MSELYDNLSSAPVLNVIPESCLSFAEEASFVAEFALNEHNHLIESIAMEELAAYEETQTMLVYEGNNAEALKGKVKAFMVKLFGAMKKFFTNIKNFFDSRKKLAKSIKITKDDVKNLPADVKLGTTHQFFDFGKVKFGANAIKFGKEVDKTFKALSNGSKEEIKQAASMLNEKMVSSISGADVKTIAEMKKVLKAEMVNDTVKVDKAWLLKNFDQVYAVVCGDKVLADIKNAYNSEKKVLDTLFDTVSAAGSDDKFMDVVAVWSGVIYDVVNTANQAYAVAFDVYKRMTIEYASILMKAQKAAGKKKEVAKESVEADVPYTSQYDMVDSAFDF